MTVFCRDLRCSLQIDLSYLDCLTYDSIDVCDQLFVANAGLPRGTVLVHCLQCLSLAANKQE